MNLTLLSFRRLLAHIVSRMIVICWLKSIEQKYYREINVRLINTYSPDLNIPSQGVALRKNAVLTFPIASDKFITKIKGTVWLLSALKEFQLLLELINWIIPL